MFILIGTCHMGTGIHGCLCGLNQPPGRTRLHRCKPLARIVLDLKCVKCQVKFKRSLEERRRTMIFAKGEMVHLEDACPDKCGGEWFTIEKLHSIRKFKRHY